MGNTLVNLYRNVSPDIPLKVYSSPSGTSNYNPQSGVSNYNPQAAGLFNPQTATETLPNGGGSYNPAGKSTIFQNPPAVPTAPVTPETDLYAKYRDPKTGEVMTPAEYALYLGNKVPKGSGQISNYAGDAMTNPNESAAGLTSRATNLNNARNDIATGTEDPYGVGNKSGIAYSPTELKAIEKAYAGVYDPALNDVFARLQEKQDEEAQKARMAETVFKTNEAIRQWQATTGSKKNGTGAGTYNFSDTQLAKGAAASGLGLKLFEAIEDDDIKNFYINMPSVKDNISGKSSPFNEVFQADIKAIMDREKTPDEVADVVNSSNMPPTVKAYLIQQIPEVPEKKDSWIRRVLLNDIERGAAITVDYIKNRGKLKGDYGQK